MTTALERALHWQCPEWGESIKATRSKLSFSFDLSDEGKWQWLVSGGHRDLLAIALNEVHSLGVGELYQYYLSCFYSDYDLPGGNIEFDKIQGPPWLTFKCPAAQRGSEWQTSVDTIQAELYNKIGLDPSAARKFVSGEFLSWFFYGGGCNEAASLALEKINELGLPEVEAVLLVCCLLPSGAKYMVDQSELLMERCPQVMEWEHFAAYCPDRNARSRVRAYPSHIDWTEGATPPAGRPVIPQKSGVRIGIEFGQPTLLQITWDPLIATSESDVVEVAKALHRYYDYHYRQRDVDQAPGILAKLSAAKRRGGRPRRGPAWDAIAIECAKLKDIKGLTYKEIGLQFEFPLQKDSYGNLSQCSTAKRLVRRGRELLTLN